MRGLVAAGVVGGMLLVGGLPALAIGLAVHETTPVATVASAPSADASGTPRHEEPGSGRDRDTEPDDHADDHADHRDDHRADGHADGHDRWRAHAWGRGRAGAPLPGWRGPRERPGGAPGRAPGAGPQRWELLRWELCVGRAAARLPEGRLLDPRAACGPRPVTPGPPGPTPLPSPAPAPSSGTSP
jgi:hypothetical protein